MAISVKLSGNTSSSHYSKNGGTLSCSTNSSTSATYSESFKVYLNDSTYPSCSVASGAISISQETKPQPAEESWCIVLSNSTTYDNVKVVGSVSYTKPDGSSQTDDYVIYIVSSSSYKETWPASYHVVDGSYCFTVKSGTTPTNTSVNQGLRYDNEWHDDTPEGTSEVSTSTNSSTKRITHTLSEGTAPCSLSVSPTSLTINGTGITGGSISVTSSTSFSVSSNKTWLTVSTGTSKVSYDATKNNGVERSGTITITNTCGESKTVSVTQNEIAKYTLSIECHGHDGMIANGPVKIKIGNGPSTPYEWPGRDGLMIIESDIPEGTHITMTMKSTDGYIRQPDKYSSFNISEDTVVDVDFYGEND